MSPRPEASARPFQVPDPEPPAQPSPAEGPQGEEAVRVPKHILFVDDETLVAEVTSQILEDLGFRVTVRRDGADALEFYRQSWREVDLVILDMMMPRMGGKEAFLAMQRVNPGIKAFIVSGYSVQGEAQFLLESGAMGFLQKPYRRLDLVRMVEQSLGPRTP
jgi:CheY-like chemotaxis protein